MTIHTPTFTAACPKAVINGIDIAPALECLSPQDAAAARMALAFDCLTEPLMAILTQSKVQTLRDWRVDRKGPASIKMGKTVFYPIDEVARLIGDLAAGHRDAVRPRQR